MLSRFSWLSESCSSRSDRNVGLLIVHSLCLRGDFDCVLHHDASCLQAGLQVFPISSSCSSEHYFRDQWVAYLLPKRPVRWSTACFSIRRTTATLRRSRSNLRPFLSLNFFFFFFFFFFKSFKFIMQLDHIVLTLDRYVTDLYQVTVCYLTYILSKSKMIHREILGPQIKTWPFDSSSACSAVYFNFQVSNCQLHQLVTIKLTN